MAKTKAPAAPVAPTHRVRSKSMPAPARGRSPSAKSLKKAAKKLEANKDKFTTPPPKRTGSPGVSSVSSSSSVKRKVSFAPAPEVHGTPAKKAEEKDMKVTEAEEILKSLKDTKDKQTEQLDSSSGSEDDVEAEKKKSAPKEKKGKGNREDASSKGAKQKAKKKDEDKESKKGAEEKDEEQESEKRSGEKAVSKKGGHKAEEKAASKKKGAEKKTEEKASKKDDDEEKAASKKGAEKKTGEKASKNDDASSKRGVEKMTEDKASKKDKEQKAEEKASKAEEMASKKGAEEKAEEEDDEESSDNESNDEEASESSDDSEDEEDDKSNESDESDMEKEEESQKEEESEKAEESDKEDSDEEGSSEEESDEEKEEEAEEPAESRAPAESPAPAESLALVPVGILKRPAAKTEEEDHQDEDEDEDDNDEEQDEEDSSDESESPATKKKKTEGTKGKIQEKSKEKGDEDKKTNKKQKKAKEEDDEEKGRTEKSKALEEAEKNLLKGDTGKEKKDKKEKKAKKAKKEKKEKDEDKEGKVKNSTKYRKEWQDTRLKLFNDYMDCGKDFAKVEALFQTRLEETQRSSIKYGFRNDQWLIKHHGEKKALKIMQRKKSLGLTMEDPEFPGEDEYLFFVMVEFNIEDIRELRRITQLELTGTLDADGVKAFVEAGGCLDGKQHLALGDKMGADGIQKMLGAVGIKNDGAKGKGIKRRRNTNAAENSAPKEVVPETPLQKAAKLVEKVLKDANNCRDHAFKLRPIAMSSDLILQLKACAVKLQEAAEKLQARVKQQKNKNKHYAAIISEVNETRSTAAERISLAKALIRAVDKPKPKARASKEPKEPNASKEATGGETVA